jgi:hypothetical protein
VANLLDQVYELRDGTGIGVFAPPIRAASGYLKIALVALETDQPH